MAEEEKKPRSKKKLLLLVLIGVVVLGGLGGGGWFAYNKFFKKAPPAAEGQAPGAEGQAPADQSQMVTLPTFLVNLADPLGRRYLKMTLDVEVPDKIVADELNKLMPKVRDSILLLLSSKSYADLSTMESKILLKNEIVDRLNQNMGGAKISRVYITELVIQ